jgi:glycosyltransferase involved in cell wall biosynthesis
VGTSERDFPRRLAEIRPDLVRAYGGYWAADLCCRERLGGVPVVVSVHDSNPKLLRPAVRYADRVLCTSWQVAQLVASFGVEGGRIRLLPNRIDPEVFRRVADPTPAVRRLGDFPDGRAIVCVGRAVPQKNRDTLIRSLARLPDDYFAVLVGRGDVEGDRQLARREGVAERCFFLESVANEELPALYSWAACVCNPSRWEGFGIVFIEAAACGAAIVTSDRPPMNELLGPDQALLVRDIEDPDALAKAISSACEDETLRAGIVQRVREAAEPFAADRVSAQEIALYEEVLAAGPPGLARRLRTFAWRFWNRRILRRVRGRLSRLYRAIPASSAPLTSTRDGASTRT